VIWTLASLFGTQCILRRVGGVECQSSSHLRGWRRFTTCDPVRILPDFLGYVWRSVSVQLQYLRLNHSNSSSSSPSATSVRLLYPTSSRNVFLLFRFSMSQNFFAVRFLRFFVFIVFFSCFLLFRHYYWSAYGLIIKEHISYIRYT